VSTIDVRVADDFMIDGLAIYISIKDGPASRRLLRLHDDDAQEWEEVDPATMTKPTLTLQGEFARALLDALTRHYQGSEDTRTIRADLLHERGRVDQLIGTVSAIATGIRPDPAERLYDHVRTWHKPADLDRP
jgi:hypothetical protein